MPESPNKKPKIRIVIRILTYALAALGVAAAAPKILQMPQELEFLKAIGFSAIAVSILGVIQLAGGVLLFSEKSRLPGAMLTALAFLISSVAIFTGGNTKFGLISLLPVVLTIIVAYDTAARNQRE